MTYTIQFKTQGEIPLEAFRIMGVNVKTSATAIGRFGTGLKYAVAVILRHGGTIKLFVGGIEYEFYLHKKEFRKVTFQQVRMRKRYGVGKWLSSHALPFTTELGKDWALWQAYRELESNTRDEGGETIVIADEYDAAKVQTPRSGTVMEVDCPGFYEQISEAEVFLPEEAELGRKVYSGPIVDIYDRPSKYLYYQGIRVYALRYPARLTYDFKAPYVRLTEDRTAANSWEMMYNLTGILMREVNQKDVLYKVLSQSRKENRWANTFESADLNFDHTEAGSETFQAVAASLMDRGSGGKSIGGWYGGHRAYRERSDKISVSLPRATWDSIWLRLKATSGQPYDEEDQRVAVKQLMNQIKPEIPF